MSEWTRQTMLEDSYNDMHGIKPNIYYCRINNNQYKIRLLGGNKEIILTEIMEKGLPKVVTLEYGGNTKTFKCMHDAEVEATLILRG